MAFTKITVVPQINGDFSQSTSLPPLGWSNQADASANYPSLAYDITTSYDGLRSLRVTSADRYGGPVVLSPADATSFYPVKFGELYQLTGAIKYVSGGMLPRLNVSFLDASFSVITSAIVYVPLDSQWHLLSTPITAVPSNAMYMQLISDCEYSGGGPSSTVWEIDKFSCNRLSASDYYLSLITSEYQSAPNFLNFVNSVLGYLSHAGFCTENLPANFDLDLAVGAQLDVLGQIVGALRLVGFQPSGGVSPILDDASYRIYLRAKIAQNQWSGQVGELYSLWAKLFPGGKIIVQDNQNMTCTILMSGAFSSIMRDLIFNGYIVPRPEGVLYNYVFAPLPVFGCDLNNSFIAGFDTGLLV
jgi:Protein of unknown function (DUF2612)